jgi:hypothetical protein
MDAPRANVVLLARPAFVLELQSERMVDALKALEEAGFKVTYIKDSVNRYRIDDQEKS